jgi:hypothetical protein
MLYKNQSAQQNSIAILSAPLLFNDAGVLNSLPTPRELYTVHKTIEVERREKCSLFTNHHIVAEISEDS